MPVERREDGSVSIRSKNGSTVIGRMIAVADDKHKEKYEKWVEDCAKLVSECAHTFRETEQYFLEHCDTLLLDPSDKHMKSFKFSVIMNHCKDKLKHKPSEFSFKMTDEEIEKWHLEDNAMREEAMNSYPEDFGLIMRGYYLPRIENNKIFYEEACEEARRFMENNDSKHHQVEMPDIYFFFEEATENFQASGVGRNLMEQLIIFRGVTKEDIKRRSQRFLGYISALREMGRLPDFREK